MLCNYNLWLLELIEKVAFRFPELYTNFWQQKEDIVSLMPRPYSICFRYACNAINTESSYVVI